MSKKIKIQFDYSNGPLWKDKVNTKTGELKTGIPCIDNDREIQELNDKAAKMYDSLYSVENGFDSEEFEKIKPELRGLVERIIRRLLVLNDGTFEIENKTDLYPKIEASCPHCGAPKEKIVYQNSGPIVRIYCSECHFVCDESEAWENGYQDVIEYWNHIGAYISEPAASLIKSLKEAIAIAKGDIKK